MCDAEKLNMEIFRAVAAEQGRDLNDVIGTGVFRENVPSYIQELLYQIPSEENSRLTDNNSGQSDLNSRKDAFSNLDINDGNEDSVFQFKNVVTSWLKIKMIDKNTPLLTSWLVKTSDGNILKSYE